MNTNVINIFIKFPSKLIWIYLAIIVSLNACLSWLDIFSDTMFWILGAVFMSISFSFFHLAYKFYSSTSLKKIVINSDSNIVLVYTLPKNKKPHDYRTVRQFIKLDVKGNVMKLLENKKYIAKVYKNTLKNKNDWEWLINYFSTK